MFSNDNDDDDEHDKTTVGTVNEMAAGFKDNNVRMEHSML